MKLREFWIHEDYGVRHSPPDNTTPYRHSYIHVRQVSPDYDKAVEYMIETLNKISGKAIWQTPVMRQLAIDALAAFEKVKGDE